jgi:hypothetical protein
MAIYSNETDPNAKQWDDTQHERSMLTSPSYREWWEANKERILEEDELRHNMNMKYRVAESTDEFLDNKSDE